MCGPQVDIATQRQCDGYTVTFPRQPGGGEVGEMLMTLERLPAMKMSLTDIARSSYARCSIRLLRLS